MSQPPAIHAPVRPTTVSKTTTPTPAERQCRAGPVPAIAQACGSGHKEPSARVMLRNRMRCNPARRNQQHGRPERTRDGEGVDGAHQAVQLGEAGLEGQGQQEAGEQLNTRLGDSSSCRRLDQLRSSRSASVSLRAASQRSSAPGCSCARGSFSQGSRRGWADRRFRPRLGVVFRKSVLVAGIDSSTQSCKVVVCDADTGEIVRSGRRRIRAVPRWTRHCGGRAADGHRERPAASTTSPPSRWPHNSTAWSAWTTGAVVRNALLWNDTRSSARPPSRRRTRRGRGRGPKRVGVVPVASFTVTKLRWLAEHEPENADATAAVCLPHDWLTWRLRGRPTCATCAPTAATPAAPATSRRRRAATSRTCSSWRSGADTPRCHGCSARRGGRRRPGRRGSARAPATTRRRRSAWAPGRGLRRLDRDVRRRQRRHDARRGRDGPGRRLRRRHGAPSAGLRRSTARRSSTPSRRCSASTTTSWPGWRCRRRRCRRPDAGAVLRGGAHAQPARCHGRAARHDDAKPKPANSPGRRSRACCAPWPYCMDDAARASTSSASSCRRWGALGGGAAHRSCDPRHTRARAPPRRIRCTRGGPPGGVDAVGVASRRRGRSG